MRIKYRPHGNGTYIAYGDDVLITPSKVSWTQHDPTQRVVMSREQVVSIEGSPDEVEHVSIGGDA